MSTNVGLTTSRRLTPSAFGDGLHQPRLAGPQGAAQGNRRARRQHLGQGMAQGRGGGFVVGVEMIDGIN